MISFEQARQVVLSEWPDYEIAGYGYEADEHWLLILLPLTAGGRIPAVDKTTGEISWINENAEAFDTSRPIGTQPGGEVVELSALVAHLPGKHDQASHGRGGGMTDRAVVREAFQFTDSRSGLTAKLHNIDTADDGTVFASGRIVDGDGQVVGNFSRDISADGKTAVHNELILDREMQGQGFATRFNAHAEQIYREHGVERIELFANMDVGGYAWARAGYNFKSDTDRAAALQHVTAVAGGYSASVRQELARAMRNPDVTPIELAMIGHTPGARMWPGKEMMLGSSWTGVKQL